MGSFSHFGCFQPYHHQYFAFVYLWIEQGCARKKSNSKWNKDVCLNSSFKEQKNSHKKQGINKILLHHDNSPIHTSKIITKYLDENKVKTLKHPPYSPDLSPCDFWLFPLVKQRMRGSLNLSKKELIEKFKNELKKLTKKDFNKCFDIQIKRCNKVLLKNGNYF